MGARAVDFVAEPAHPNAGLAPGRRRRRRHCASLSGRAGDGAGRAGGRGPSGTGQLARADIVFCIRGCDGRAQKRGKVAACRPRRRAGIGKTNPPVRPAMAPPQPISAQPSVSQRVIHVGIGAFGRRWCRDFLKANVDDGTIEVVALVGRDDAALEIGRSALGLPPERCFTDASEAFGKVAADFCTVAVTPAHHEAVIDQAIANGLDILFEKPIADTMAATLRIARKVEDAGRKMAVTMSHRFDQDKTTLRRIVRSGFSAGSTGSACDFRATCGGTWHGARRSGTRWRIRC